MKKTKGLLLTLIILTAVIFTACGSGTTDAYANIQNGESIVIKHELGETIIDGKPERVIVFDYGLLDAIDTIGEDIMGLPKATIPPHLDKYKSDDYTDVGTLKEPNFETIYELSPDLIIISERQVSLYDEFKKIAPTVYLPIDGTDYLNSFKINMETIGKIFNKEDLMAQEVSNIEKSIEELNELAKVSNSNALFVMANDGNLSVYGIDSRFGMLYKEFGLTPVDENIDSSTHGQKISFEYIVEKDPDYLFVMDRAAVAGGELSALNVMENDLIRNTKAYKNDTIIPLDAHVWYVSSGGLTGTTKMLEEVKAALSN